MSELRRMRIKGRRSTHAHYMYPTYEGAPFYETLCGVEKLAEEWEDDEDSPIHHSCAASARGRMARAEQAA